MNVRLRVRTFKDALVVPTAAVQYGSRGTYVYFIGDEEKAKVRDVVVGPSDGATQSIAKGLEVGERVIVEGVDRLREGRVVVAVGDAPAPSAKGEKGEKGKSGEKSKKGK